MANMNLDAETLEKIAQAGDLLLRAAAVIGTLPTEQQEALHTGHRPDELVRNNFISGLYRNDLHCLLSIATDFSKKW